jgi:hypothetical protein
MNTKQHSRGAVAPEALKIDPLTEEGAGNAGCSPHPQPRTQMKKAYELFTTGAPGHPGIPCATVLTVYLVLSPVIGLSCHRYP